ncbi:MAG: helix-turn-helix domain-containing protein [Leptolyngbyaceae cyanobacterium SM2_3_12]|nr:helix-turn-helix domain-containing protein [Leptolyngbyaceae cyanobacterium SM2_3_12]
MAPSPTDVLDYSQRLQTLMQAAQIASYRALSARAGVSRGTIARLRQGQVTQMRVDLLLRLSHALGVSGPRLVAEFSDTTETTDIGEAPEINGLGREDVPSPSLGEMSALQAENTALRQECERLQRQLESQQQAVRQQVQREAIAILEPWLLQWPTAVRAVQNNDTLPATRLLPLTKPLDNLLQSWDVTPIGTVGEELPYDPQHHQPVDGMIEPGQQVRVRYMGYRQGDRLLYRAKVSPA